MFDPQRGLVILVEKNRPAWQASCLNGVGGKIEPQDASVHAAMSREFHEEAGVMTQPAEWEEFATLRGPDFTVHMMRTFSDDWHRISTQETEQVRWYPVSAITAGAFKTVRMLPILIPIALSNCGLQLPVVLLDGQPDEANAG